MPFSKLIALKQGTRLLQFGATWCAPCRTMQPIAEEIAKANNIEFAKVDIEEHADLANLFNVRSVPCFIVVTDGKEIGRLAAAIPNSLRSMVKAALS